MTLGVIARIHWQALRLWLKQAPFFRQPAAPADFVTPATRPPADPCLPTRHEQHHRPAERRPFPAPPRPAAARTTLQLLQRLRHGSLTLQLPDGTLQRFGGGAGPLASMRLTNWNVFGAALKSGDIGFAESYIAGDWSTPQLTDLLRLLIANREALEDVVYGSWIGRLAYRLRHLLNRNSKANSRKNIHAHYDLGNAFYELWLDET